MPGIIAHRHPEEIVRTLQTLAAVCVLGVRCRVRLAGLEKLARTPPIGHRILEKCLRVINGIDEERRYWPLLDLVKVERAVAIQCFPDHPEHDPDDVPAWLERSPITEARR